MNLRFDNPQLLWLLPAMAVPLLLHLFARARPPVLAFSSVDFVLRAVRANARMKRPRDLLLLLVRTLLVGLAVLVFTRPVLQLSGSADEGERSVAIIVDASASMRTIDGAQTRFAQACAKASDLLSRLRRGDRAALIWAEHSPRSVFPSPGVNISHLQQTTRTARCSLGDADVTGSVALALEMLSETGGRRQLCIISDFQRTVWETVRLNMPDGVELITVPVGHETAPNLALTDISCAPACPVAGDTVRIHCEVANFSDAPRGAVVYLEAGARRLERNVNVGPWARAAADFTFAAETVETLPVSATVEDSAFVPDNSRHLQVNITPARCVALAGGPGTAEWSAVLGVLPGVAVKQAQIGAALPACDMLIVCDGTPAAMPLVKTALEVGIPTLIEPAAGNGGDLWRELLREKWHEAPDIPATRAGSSEPVTLRQGPASACILGVFSADAVRDLCALPLTPVAALPDLPDGRRLLSFSDGTAAIVSWQAGAEETPLVLWNVPVGSGSADLIALPELLLPLAGECIREFALPAAQPQPPRFPGERVRIPEAFRERLDDLTLIGPGGDRIALPAAGGQSGPAWTEPLLKPGVYEWRLGAAAAGFELVNFPVVECDLRPLTTAPGSEQTVVLGDGSDYDALRDGIPLWPRLYALLLAVLAGECLLVLRNRRGAAYGLSAASGLRGGP